MNVALVLLAGPTAGGWPTFTAHLAHGLRAAGHEPLLFRVGKTTERKTRDFGRGLAYQNLSPDTAAALPAQMPTLLTAVDKKGVPHAERLLEAGASVVVHDPTELRNGLPELLAGTDRPVLTIRRVVGELLRAQGVENVSVPHPYARTPEAERKSITSGLWAVAYSRVDFDKGTHTIVEANALLPGDRQIEIYGAQNRIYAHHKLTKMDPLWERNYRGGWPARSSLWYGAQLAASARYVVDLSAIKGDGGGTQYSFLEALDAGRPLIISKGWLTGDKAQDEILPAVAATVTDAAGLADAVHADLAYDTWAADEILRAHDAADVARLVLNTMEGRR